MSAKASAREWNSTISRKRVQPDRNTLGPSPWVGLSRDQFSQWVQQREEERQKEHSVCYRRKELEA